MSSSSSLPASSAAFFFASLLSCSLAWAACGRNTGARRAGHVGKRRWQGSPARLRLGVRRQQQGGARVEPAKRL